MEPLSERHIREALEGVDAGPFGAHAHYLARTGSTNDVLREMAEQGAPEGTVIVADEQTAGRGRMGRVWAAPPRSSLLLSVLFRPALPPEHVYRLVMICGLAAAEACEAEEGIGRVDVKWPNDLQIGGKKLAGVLAENAFSGRQLAWVIVGVGLNVNQTFAAPDPLAGTATSLRMVSGREHDRAALLARVLAGIRRWHGRLEYSGLVQAWQARCVTVGQRVRVEAAGQAIEGHAEKIDASGALWLRDDAGQRHCLAAGEVTILRG
jgi:BirA family biotin operon repressor/biotin-[acetyl-CoA-carboxylase] ligase